MLTYDYRSTTREGTILEGVVEAPDEKTAIAILNTRGVIPLNIAPKKESLFSWKFSFKSAKGEVLTVTTELYALLNAGLPLDRSLNILTDITENKKMKQIVFTVLKSIREGSSFSDALEKHPLVFSSLYVNMIRAGESGGVLEIALEKLIEFLESSKELKDHIFSAMIYPVILVVTGFISIIVMITFVLPKFAVVFRDMGAALPLPTQFLIAASNIIINTWWMVVILVVAGWFVLRSYLKTNEGRYKWDNLKIKIMGDVILKLETARFCRTLGALIRSGVPLLKAVQNSRDIIGNYVISSSVGKISAGIKEGQGIAKPLADARIFPQLALSMIKVGEETGQLDIMLLKIADTYEKSLKMSVKRFISILEPALILGMGLLTGFIVISMLMAIFSITDIPF